MIKTVIALDMGTGGLKSSVIDSNGKILASKFVNYDTYFPKPDFHEQRPSDWWSAVVSTVNELFSNREELKSGVIAISISGHSLGAVPIDCNGELLTEFTPIWSDKRASKQASDIFENIDYEEWYSLTGNGFPAECYSIFKIAWLRDNYPDIYEKADVFLGTKDYINYRLTGVCCTDYSYASGSGAFDLYEWGYHNKTLKASGVDIDKLPVIKDSSDIVGTLQQSVAEELGLSSSIKVVAGGVDNSCMALGARGNRSGRVYTSLGSSAWVALTSDRPVLDFKYKPFVFAHVIKGLYASATAIFSAGNSFRWVRDTLCADLLKIEESGGESAYVALTKMAAASPKGSNRVIFNPSLAGGSMLEESPNICGGYCGLSLGSSKEDIIRATLEGVALNLSISLEVLMKYCPDVEEMLIVGGGAKSDIWMQIFSECYGMPIALSSINQEAASLGAAALAFVGCDIWDDYSKMDDICSVESRVLPTEEGVEFYSKQLDLFKQFAHYMAKMGESLSS